MEHKSIRKFRLAGYIGDQSDNAMTLTMTPPEGDPMLVSFSVEAGALLAGQLIAALKTIAAQNGTVARIPAVPERISKFDAMGDVDTAGKSAVLLSMEGDGGGRLYGAMTTTDARRLGAMLMTSAEVLDKPYDKPH